MDQRSSDLDEITLFTAGKDKEEMDTVFFSKDIGETEPVSDHVQTDLFEQEMSDPERATPPEPVMSGPEGATPPEPGMSGPEGATPPEPGMSGSEGAASLESENTSSQRIPFTVDDEPGKADSNRKKFLIQLPWHRSHNQEEMKKKQGKSAENPGGMEENPGGSEGIPGKPEGTAGKFDIRKERSDRRFRETIRGSRIAVSMRSFWPEWTIMIIVLVIMVSWSFITGSTLPGGPDELMRNFMVKWLYEHPGKLPIGDEKAIRDEIWGLSYGYYPYLSYIVSAVFDMVGSIFCKSSAYLLHVARLADVLFLEIAAGFTIKAGKKLFGRDLGLLFACMVIFLPGFHFLGTYINNDSMALMACAIIFCAWAGAYKEGWSWKNCLMLAAGIGLCALSYYNAYGWILCSFFYFIFSILADHKKPMKKRILFMITRGLFITAVTLAIAGWWFVRQIVLHDGDLIGIRSANAVAEKYAQSGYKPSEHGNPSRWGWSLMYFFFYQNPGWPHNWFILSWVSFVGTFGHFDIYMKEGVSKGYLLFMFIGILSTILMLDMYRLHDRSRTKFKVKRDTFSEHTITIRIEKAFSQRGIFHLFLILAMLIAMLLYFYYAYFSDLQAQGRYFINAVFPIMYFVTCGYGILVKKIFRKREKIQVWIWRIMAAVWILGAIYNFFTVVVPAYC